MVSVQTLKRLAKKDAKWAPWKTSGPWGYPGHGFWLKGHYKADGSPVFLRTASVLKTYARDLNRVVFTLKYGLFEWLHFDTAGYVAFPLDQLLTREPARRR